MPALRTSLVALAVGGAAVTTGVVATGATAAPAPAAAVTANSADGTAAATDGDGVLPFRPGVRHWLGSLSDSERQCLDDADLRRPAWPMDDDERAEVRAQVESAADACGVELPFAPARAFWDGLTDTERQCLKDAGPTRPLGPLTSDERVQLRDDRRSAAEQCGVTLPSRESVTGS
jgi:hypothetical protein